VDTVQKLLLFLHLVGMAALLGGSLVQLTAPVKRVNGAMRDGALTQVVTGLLLVGVIEGQDDPIDRTKIAVKFAIAIVIAVGCWINRRKPQIPNGLLGGIIVLTLANVAIAVFW
jgi:hypothetical protein